MVATLAAFRRVSLRRGARAGANPWDAKTLEWSVASPPPAENFSVIPQASGGAYDGYKTDLL